MNQRISNFIDFLIYEQDYSVDAAYKSAREKFGSDAMFNFEQELRDSLDGAEVNAVWEKID